MNNENFQTIITEGQHPEVGPRGEPYPQAQIPKTK